MLKYLNKKKQVEETLDDRFSSVFRYPFLYTSSIQHLAMQIDYLKQVLESRIAWKT